MRQNPDLPRILSPEGSGGSAPIAMEEVDFRWQMNASAMATENLAEGIRNFDADHKALIGIVSKRL